MPIKNQGERSAIEDILTVMADGQDVRSEALFAAKQKLIADHALLLLELARVKEQLGAQAEPVKQLQARSKQQLEVIRALNVEQDIAVIRTDFAETSDTIVHGRLSDASYNALAGLKLLIVSEARPTTSVNGIPPAITDKGGYFAFSISAQIAASLQSLGTLTLAVQLPGALHPLREVQPFSVLEGEITTIDAHIGKESLHTIAINSTGGGPVLNLALASVLAGP